MKNGFFKVCAATPRVTVADTGANSAALKQLVLDAAAAGAALLVTPELAVTAYTCSDLFLSQRLLDAAEAAVADLATFTAGRRLLAFFGAPLRCGGKLYNCAVACYDGKILGVVPKSNIPNYGEFYEYRHFTPFDGGPDREITVAGRAYPFGTRLLFRDASAPDFTVAAEICEDLWVPCPPSAAHAAAGATVICNLSASDEIIGKAEYRRELVRGQSARLVCGYLYADAGDGESTTDLVFAGHDLVCENGSVLAETEPFSGTGRLAVSEIDVQKLAYERRRMNTYPAASTSSGYEVIPFDLPLTETVLTRRFARFPFVPSSDADRARRCELILTMQSRGLAKRLEASHSRGAVIGISGGLDSCLALLVSVRAMDFLGRPRTAVTAVTMPCFGTTHRTRSNAEELCSRLGVTFRCVDITAAVKLHFADIGHDESVRDVVYENVQARERTQVLMDLANGSSSLVVGTGDLSEMALGWSTYNGDHMSMYGVNCSVPKTLVRHIVRYYADTCGDAALAAVLLDILATPVSPELLPADASGAIAQKTEDIVGPYELHDFFLYYTVRFGFPPDKLRRLARYTFAGVYSGDVIDRWSASFTRRFFAQQFKRSCVPDGPKVGSVTLSPRGDWRMPSDAAAAVWTE